MFYHPSVTVFVGLVLSVIVFCVFRGLLIRREEDIEDPPENFGLEELEHGTGGIRGGATLNDTASAVIPELKETPRQTRPTVLHCQAPLSTRL